GGVWKGKVVGTVRGMGWYFVELWGERGDRMNLHLRRCICLDGEARLARRLRKLRPMMIVTVVRSIGSNVRRAEAAVGYCGSALGASLSRPLASFPHDFSPEADAAAPNFSSG